MAKKPATKPAPNKAAEPAETKPDPSYNGPNRRQFLDVLGEYTEIRFQQMRWASKAGALMDRFEAKGGERDDIRDGFKLGKLSTDEQQHEVRRSMRVAGFMGVTTWEETGQATFSATFDAPQDEIDTLGVGGAPIGSRLSLARAYADGYNTGKAGGSLSDCTLAAESEEAKKWAEGFGDGVEDRPAEKPAKEKKKVGKSAALEMAETAAAMPATKPKGKGQKALAAPKPAEDVKAGWHADRDFSEEPPPPVH